MTDTHTTADIHQEKVFEAHIVACLMRQTLDPITEFGANP